MSRLIDGDRLMMSLADWWYSSFGEDETEEAKAIRKVMDKVEESLDTFTVPQWIPCSERLPEKTGMYITTTMYGEVYCDYWQDDNFRRCEEVIAWQPLPTPYQNG